MRSCQDDVFVKRRRCFMRARSVLHESFDKNTYYKQNRHDAYENTCVYMPYVHRAKRGQETRERERGDEGRNTNSIHEGERERKKTEAE